MKFDRKTLKLAGSMQKQEPTSKLILAIADIEGSEVLRYVFLMAELSERLQISNTGCRIVLPDPGYTLDDLKDRWNGVEDVSNGVDVNTVALAGMPTHVTAAFDKSFDAMYDDLQMHLRMGADFID